MLELIDVINSIDNFWVYCLLFISAYLENIFPPVPGDTVVIFGAFLVGIRRLEFTGVLLAATAGSFLGFMTLYFVGLFWGREFFLRKNYRFLSRDKILKVEGWFAKYGSSVLLANRFLSGARSVVSLFAGIANIRPTKVALLAGISCCLWNTFLIYMGSEVVHNWRKLVDFIGNYNKIVFAVILIGVTVFIVRKKFFVNKN